MTEVDAYLEKVARNPTLAKWLLESARKNALPRKIPPGIQNIINGLPDVGTPIEIYIKANKGKKLYKAILYGIIYPLNGLLKAIKAKKGDSARMGNEIYETDYLLKDTSLDGYVHGDSIRNEVLGLYLGEEYSKMAKWLRANKAVTATTADKLKDSVTGIKAPTIEGVKGQARGGILKWLIVVLVVITGIYLVLVVIRIFTIRRLKKTGKVVSYWNALWIWKSL